MSSHKNDNNVIKRFFISENDLVDLDTSQDLPYMKCIELTNYTPQHFDLDSWTPQFRIPDHWMKKIYRNEVYKDTDLPDPETEVISDEQRKCLRDYLEQSNLHSEPEPSRRGSLRSRPPKDDLKKSLEGEDGDIVDDDGIDLIEIDSDSNERVVKKAPCDKKTPTPLSESRVNDIAIYRHRIQPEEVVVEMALEKMKKLSQNDERRYRELLRDEDFMKLLNCHVEKYIKQDPT